MPLLIRVHAALRRTAAAAAFGNTGVTLLMLLLK
jgi:hypothetical protein